MVMRDGDVLVFVEVKTRVEGSRVPGFAAVDDDKRRVLRRAIAGYLRGMRPPPRTHRLDVMEVTWPRDEATDSPTGRHLRNVSLPRRR